MPVEVVDVDYNNPQHARDWVMLLDGYARDPMGGGTPLADDVKERLARDLASRSFAFSVIAYVEGQPAGLVNCFEAYSTFSARPLVNIHDVAVSPDFRGQRIAQQMLQRVESIAMARGCCKLTLEVLSGNTVAQGVYARFGFDDFAVDSETGTALFWQKKL